MPRNQPGADKSGPWLGSRADRTPVLRRFLAGSADVTHPLAPLASELAAGSVRYALIGVSAANLYGPAGQARIRRTDDIDLSSFRRIQSTSWRRGTPASGRPSTLWLGRPAPERPRDRWLAERVVERRTLTRASGPNALQIDLTLIMAGFDFETVWKERRDFLIEGVPVPTARLASHRRIEAGRGTTKGSLVSGDAQGRARAAAEKTVSWLTRSEVKWKSYHDVPIEDWR